MRVRATQRGFYGQLRQAGDEFDCPEEMLGLWMEVIEPAPEPAPEPVKRGRPKKSK